MPGNKAAAGPDESLLTSKITAPPLPGWAVRRERIERLIDDGARGPLTVITGPPGAGKTMALASWAAARRHTGPVAWVTLDRFDNGPEILWSYIGESLRRRGVAVPADLNPPGSGPADHARLHRFASMLAAQDPPVALILDDVHVLTDPRSLEGLSYVLRNASAGLRVLVAARMDPLLPLHRYRLAGELADIRAADLAFTVPEAQKLMAQHRVTLATAALETLTAKNEGWAAGLRLAAMSMEGHPEPERLAIEFGAGQGAVTGYFVEEVLNARPAAVREVLLKTSILDRVSPSLAADLAGDRHAEAVIPELAEANAFVLALGGDWYRYHPLFAEVLRLKLRHERPDEVRRLHQRAASWLRRNGLLAESVSQLAAAGEWQVAAQAAVEDGAAGGLVGQRVSTALAEAFRPMPVTAETANPAVLIIAAAMRLRDLDEPAAEALLRRAELALAEVPATAELRARLAIQLICADLARRRGDLRGAQTAATRAADVVAAMPEEMRSRHPGARTELLFLRGAVETWAGHLAAAAATLEKATAAADGGHGWADCAGYWALTEALRGNLGIASGLAAPATVPGLGQPRHRGVPPVISAAAETALAWVHLERGQVGDASERLARAQDALRGRPDRLVAAICSLAAARHELAKGRAAPAERIARGAREGWAPPPWLDRRLVLTESHAYTVAGDVTAALGAAGRIRPRFAPDVTAAVARAQLAAGNLDAASRELADQRDAPVSAAPDAVRLEERLVEAELGYRGGDPARGRHALEEALRLAEPEQLRLPFAMERSWIQPVFRRDPVLAERFRRMFQPARTRLASLAAEPGAGADSGGEPGTVNGHGPGTVIVEELSDREREVLRYVSGMLSTAEIAGEMYISVNTVKSHLKSIFRKLGASRRGEAVRRARQLQLILMGGADHGSDGRRRAAQGGGPGAGR